MQNQRRRDRRYCDICQLSYLSFPLICSGFVIYALSCRTVSPTITLGLRGLSVLSRKWWWERSKHRITSALTFRISKQPCGWPSNTTLAARIALRLLSTTAIARSTVVFDGLSVLAISTKLHKQSDDMEFSLLDKTRVRPLVWAVSHKWHLLTVSILYLMPLFIIGCAKDIRRPNGLCDYEYLLYSSAQETGYSTLTTDRRQLQSIYDVFFRKISKNGCKEDHIFAYNIDVPKEMFDFGMNVNVKSYYVSHSASEGICVDRAGIGVTVLGGGPQVYCSKPGWVRLRTHKSVWHLS